MKRVIMTAKHLDAGGVETFITSFYPYIDKNKYSIDFLITKKYEDDSKGYYEDELVAQGAHIYRISSKNKSVLRAYKDLKKFFVEHPEYEIFHINDGGGAAFPLYIASKFSNCRCIVHSHSTDSKRWKQNVIMTLFRKYVVSRAYCIGCAQEAAEWMFGKKAEYKLLHSGIDTKKYTYSEQNRKRIRDEYKIDENTFVIGHVGRFNIHKNHEFLIDIFKDYLTVNSDSKLMLLGIGELEQKIKQKALDYSISDKVIFVGNSKQVERYLSAMDLFLFPSLSEGLSVALIEAQANGLPCLISDSIPKENHITELVHQKSISAITEEWITEIENMRKQANKKRDTYALEIKEKGFDRENTARRLMEMYEDITS